MSSIFLNTTGINVSQNYGNTPTNISNDTSTAGYASLNVYGQTPQIDPSAAYLGNGLSLPAAFNTPLYGAAQLGNAAAAQYSDAAAQDFSGVQVMHPPP